MAKYTVIADAGKAIVDMLKDQIVPEPLSKIEAIGVCDPKERGSFIVGLHPYDIREVTENRNNRPIVLPNGQLQNPPTAFNIKYMLSVVSKAEPATKSIDEARILGKIIQVMQDNSTIPDKYLSESLKMAGQKIKIESQPMELEEKVKVWTMFSEPYKLSVFYTVGPIYVDSNIVKEPATRVKSVEVGSQSKEMR